MVRPNKIKDLFADLLGSVELVRVLAEQVEGLRRALPLVHVTCDQDALHAHLQLPGAPPSFRVILAAPEVLLAALPKLVLWCRHLANDVTRNSYS